MSLTLSLAPNPTPRPYARCELGKYLATLPEGRLAEAEARGAARQLASAVAHFHHLGVAHMT